MKKLTTLVLIYLLLGFLPGFSQHCSLYKVSYTDSLVANAKTSILYNKLIFNNPNPKHVRLEYKVEVPEGYKALTKIDKVDYLELAPGQQKVIPLNLLKLSDASPEWKPVNLFVWEKHLRDTHVHQIFLKTLPDHKFSFRASKDPVNLFKRPDQLPFEAYLKNTGNIEEDYSLLYANEALGIREVINLHLKPHQDTNITQYIDIKQAHWARMYKEDILLTVTGKDKSVSHSFPLVKARSTVSQHALSHRYIPLTITGGLLSMGDQLTYFGGISGDISLGQDHAVSFFYQSKQFGTLYYGYQPNVFGINYRYKRWLLMAGPVTNNAYFPSTGLGITAGYRTDKAEYTLSTNIPDPNLPYQNQNYTGFAKYRVKDKSISHTVIYNQDAVNRMNSYILMNTAEVLKRRYISLNLIGGAGMSQGKDTLTGASRQTSGYAVGYTAAIEKGKWRLTSNIDYRSLGFPGISDGSRSEMHGLYYGNEKGAIGLVYNAFYIKRNILRDSFYNSDILSYNMTRVGIDLRRSGKKMSFNSSFGLIYNQSTDIKAQGGLDRSYYLDLSHTWRSGLYANSLLSVRSIYYPQVSEIGVTAMGTFNSRYFSLNGVYTQIPVIEREGERPIVTRIERTINGGPAVNFSFFNRRLVTSFRYNLSKSVYDEVIRMGAGANISYSGHRNGVTLALSGYMPFEVSNSDQLPLSERNAIQVSLVKRINFPIPGTRQYYNMYMVLFDDRNNNGVKDDDERPLQKASVTINDEPFITNAKGGIRYKKIEKGLYELNFSEAKVDSLIPVNSFLQTVRIEKNLKVPVPFKKGKEIRGKVQVILDSFSHARMTPDLLKVIVQDSAGRKYTTITNKEGDFSFYVPAGRYKVSLNEEAFKGSPFRPEQDFYLADLEAKEEVNLSIIIKQKKRKVRYLKGGSDD